MRLAGENSGWAVGFEDEVWWWSRFALPSLRAWSEDGKPLRLVQHSVAKKDDPDPKAISSCYGLYLPELNETWLLFAAPSLVLTILLAGG
jgi:hypothetical protein